MEKELLYYSGIIVSCLVPTLVIYQFLDGRHKRTYQTKGLYTVLKMISSVILMGINLLSIPLWNMLSWIILYGIISILFYYDDHDRPITRVLEAEVMVLIFAVCEGVGVMLLKAIAWSAKIPKLPSEISSFLTMTFSMLVILFLYYLVIARIWGPYKKVKFTKQQCILHFLIAIYSLINMLIMIEVVSLVQTKMASYLLLVIMGFIVLADMYFLYFIQVLEESNQLRSKVELLEQQAALQYKFYQLQEKKYYDSIKILHDVDKHIASIEALYNNSQQQEALEYTKGINELLKPLIPQSLTGNPMLNILLSDKKQEAKKAKIRVDYSIEQVDLKFMDPIDVTTIFGNLLDNAIEETSKVNKERYIGLRVSPYYEMIAIHMENPIYQSIQWENEMPLTSKGEHHGIGLKNVTRAIEKYDGTMHLYQENEIFICNIILNS